MDSFFLLAVCGSHLAGGLTAVTAGVVIAFNGPGVQRWQAADRRVPARSRLLVVAGPGHFPLNAIHLVFFQLRGFRVCCNVFCLPGCVWIFLCFMRFISCVRARRLGPAM